jgi:hypothetical protein
VYRPRDSILLRGHHSHHGQIAFAKIAIKIYSSKLLREKVAIRKWENDVLGVYFTQRVQILYFIKKWAKKQIF